MTDMTLSAAPKAPSPLVEAAKEAVFTAILVFLLGWLMVGYQTQVLQGQPMSYVTRYSDVVWAVLLIPAGRFLLLDTVEAGAPWGSYCAERREWLTRQLAARHIAGVHDTGREDGKTEQQGSEHGGSPGPGDANERADGQT